MAMARATRLDRQASSMVMGNFRDTVLITVSRVRMDSPRSPRRARPTQRRYWAAIGSLSPYFWRISSRPAASASVPAITRAGSPGMRRTPVKTIMLITARVIAEMARRWIRYSSTVCHAAGAARCRDATPTAPVQLLPGDALDADEAVGHGLVALEALWVREDVVGVIEVQDITTAEGKLVDGLPVQGHALREVADLARPIQ